MDAKESGAIAAKRRSAAQLSLAAAAIFAPSVSQHHGRRVSSGADLVDVREGTDDCV